MRLRGIGLSVCVILGVLCLGGCPTGTIEQNPFQAYLDEYGIAGQQETTTDGAATGVAVEEVFRKDITLSLVNAHATAVLDTSFMAWVEVSSIRSAEQQDALLRGGYVQLTREVRVGSVFTLPVGTFVFDGPGTAGATPVELAPTGEGENVVPTSVSYELITPDVVLVFSQPPVSCDSVAFTYSDPMTGEILSGASTATGGYKTLAQVDKYTCTPFRPGVFLSTTGGALGVNEYVEGDSITFTFGAGAVNGAFAIITIGDAQAATGEGDGEP